MVQTQKLNYRLFLIFITIVLAIALGWVGFNISLWFIQVVKKQGLLINVALESIFIELGFVTIGVLSAILLGSWITHRLWTLRETIEQMPLADKISVLLGGLFGSFLSYIILLLLKHLKLPLIPWVSVSALIIFLVVYFSVNTVLKVRDVLVSALPIWTQMLQTREVTDSNKTALLYAKDKVVDTSVIIDGRLADIIRTGFIEGRILLPVFVLNELQMIADSEEELRRARGRRGLSVLETLKNLPNINVEVIDQISRDVASAPNNDLRLVRLAKERKAALITNDNNLQKIAELQGVSVLSVNELASSLKPVVLPGEELTVIIQRPGKEPGQGIGYLDDGTMVVIEHGRTHIGCEVKVKATSVLQSQMGKMIFGDFKEVIRHNTLKLEGGDVLR